MKNWEGKPLIRYRILIERGDQNTAYGVIVPDLPGCFSAGETADEAIVNTTEAITLWIEEEINAGRSIPQPSPPAAFTPLEDDQSEQWMWGWAYVDRAALDVSAEHFKGTRSQAD
ncbi:MULTISPECIES: type II toxin-antitoxin system HicB family antitoxin [unclassified Saccharibacter]|uniref:type II toxin-antitoxin system HicB family antitoxin n=1 Tax=unclassified Saccharibacter TaxID=2648722 RepID=UPI001927CD6C|nr:MULTISPECIES: type II toxin-antitoxin system HicB family antitoxin [unclassified Saccharibacter]